MNTKNLLLLGTLLAAAALAACGDDTTENPGTGGAGGAGATTATGTTTGDTTSTTSGGDGGGGGDGEGGAGGQGGQGGQGGAETPAAPELGEQIDRMGRPGINTALNDTFLYVDDAGLHPSDDTVRAASEDAYNAVEGAEAPAFAATMALQLGVLDGLDTVCSNQPASCPDPENPPAAEDGGCYGTLAGVLSTDVLWVNTEYTTCETYLGAEFAYLGIDIDDCGGRRPVDDVIATTYTVASGVEFDDGITAPQSLQDAAAEFPYMAPPLD
jgi:hypothetical protein